MNTTWTKLAVVTALLAGPAAAGPPAAKLNVVTTTPDLAALARVIGGDAIDVRVLAKPTEDPHFVDAKPSHIVTLNRADVLIEGGAELELGCHPSARNDRIAAALQAAFRRPPEEADGHPTHSTAQG
jgi:ABC-type Zn uptake system ZnuABC Zn-binding protein ZnuA